jgi:hypothetical protein
MVDNPQIAELINRINSLCENIVAGVQDCADLEHLTRIAGALECIFIAGHETLDYEEEGSNRRSDA